MQDLAQDYTDMAAAYQGLGYLESGITEPLNRFAEKMLDFSALLKHMVSRRPMKMLIIEQHDSRPILESISFAVGIRKCSSTSHQAARSETARL